MSDELLTVTSSKMPDEISLIKMIESRYSEINQLVGEIKTKSPKLVSQKFPLHMRRRAASHNINRLPSRTRKLVRKKLAGKDMTSQVKERKRKNCKKYQNRKKLEINHAVRESKPDRCLLHLWFVKRFKMISMDNLIIPNYNTTKNRRKIYRMSKNGCVHFYLPQVQCIQIKYKPQDSWLLVDRLTGIVCHGQPGEDILCPDKPPDHWKLTISNRDNQVFGPGHFILIPKLNILLVWCHFTICSKLLELFESVFSGTSITVEDASKNYQMFKFFGPETLQLMKKNLGKEFAFDLPTSFEKSSFVFSKLRFTYQRESSIIEDASRLDFDDEQQELEKTVIMFDIINHTHCTDIVIPYQQAKPFWYRVVHNRSHLVGGLRDFKILASDLHRLLFPDFGFPDSLVIPETKRKHWKDLSEYLNGSKDYFVIRDLTIIERLKDPTSTSEEIKAIIQSNENLKKGFIIVELICLKRGTPIEGDPVCLPTSDDFKTFLTKKNIELKMDHTGYGPVESKKMKKLLDFRHLSRQAIGFIEFGHFSLDLGRGKAFAAISFSHFPQLISLRISDTLIALTRSKKSTSYRFVKVIVDNFLPL